MKDVLIVLGVVAVSMTLVIVLPKTILAWLGCWQLGSWLGKIARNFR